MKRISTWLDRPNPLAEPVEGAGGCSLVRTSYDPADGPASHRNTVSYEHRGYMLRWDSDSEADGTVESWEQYTYDDQDLIVLHESGHASPNPDEVVRFEYDGEGRMVLEEYDGGNDGTVDYFHSWSYDGDGHLVESIYHQDYENEGAYTGTTTYTWVADRVTEIEHLGVAEDWGDSHVRVHLYATDGLPSRYDRDEDALGTVDTVTGYSWDGLDRLLAQWSDEDADGTIDEQYDLLYDGSDLPYHIDVGSPDGDPGGLDFLWNAAGRSSTSRATTTPSTARTASTSSANTTKPAG